MNNKTFIVTYQHNYGLGVAIINANNVEEAKQIADESTYIWPGYSIDELNTSIKLLILD